MTKTIHINIIENILGANDQIARENSAFLIANGVMALNIMASPGAGKTSFILKIIEKLTVKYRIGVVEGDTSACHN